MKFFTFIAVLLLVSQNLWAAVHSVSHNVATVVNLQDNDEIHLVNFPVGWGFSRVVLGVNSVPALQLSGHLVTNGCDHELHGNYEQVDFAYTGNESIVYHGPAQSLPIQWWVDANPIVSSCNESAEVTLLDSIRTILYNFADSIYSDKIKDYIDLGTLNSEKIFEGTSSNFKITNLPDWFYNRLFVQVEPMDGRELNGVAIAGGGKVEIKGYSKTISLSQKNSFAPTFEIAFPEYRKVKLKWWAEVGVPEETAVESKETILSSDSVEVEYTFGVNPYSKSSVKLVFDKRKFSDGKVPVVKKLSFDPQGPNKSNDFGVRGDIYDFDAKLNPGDSVVIAIPLDSDYQPGEDTITIEHFIAEENRWIEEPVDSIVGNYAYIKVGHFSWFRSLCRGIVTVVAYSNPVVAGCAALSKTCRNAVNGAIDKTADVIADVSVGIVNTAKTVVKWIEKLVCLDFDSDKAVEYFGTAKRKDWNPSQGKINTESVKNMGSDVLLALEGKRMSPLTKISEAGCGDDEPCKWQKTRDNLDVLLADAILAQFPTDPADPHLGISRFVFTVDDNGTAVFADAIASYNFEDYFMISSGLVEDAAWFVNGIDKCIDAVNMSGRRIQGVIDYFKSLGKLSYTDACKAYFSMIGLDQIDHMSDIPDCTEFLAQAAAQKLFGEWIMSGHQDKLISISEAMVRISLLAWLKNADGFRDYALTKYKSAYDGIIAWLDLAGPFFDYNNISVKAYGSITLFEYMFYGTDENLKMVNGGLNRHYGDNGGFSEGTGYSQYIWDDLTYVLSALKDAYKDQSEIQNFSINHKFLKSPDYMFEFSRPVGLNDKPYGLIPVEADDGVTYNPDYRVWAKLKDDPKYLAMSEAYPLRAADQKINPLVPFGFPDYNMYGSAGKVVPYRGTLWGDFKDGIGLITAVSNEGDTVALSMIAESGKMWERGQSHDQQDNLSITLTSSKKGFLIQDPGYTGFGNRSTSDGFHNYNDHNVLTNDYGQRDNRVIPYTELWSRVNDFSGDFPGFGPNVIISVFEFVSLFADYGYEYRVEGGASATVDNRMINEPQNGVIGYTAQTSLLTPPCVPPCASVPDYNRRTIMYFGSNFWVIDRPTTAGLKWHINSPLNTWVDINIHLNVSSQNDEISATVNANNIPQNSLRGDFIKNTEQQNKILQNYSYTAYDANAQTYVMNYALGNNMFEKTESNCPQGYQCFVNTYGNMRVVVPPYGGKFKLCDVVSNDECSGDARSTGITMLAKTSLGEWTTHWVLDGELTAVENGVEFPIVSATVSRSYYLFVLPNGSVISERYKGTYLPAIPILLLR